MSADSTTASLARGAIAFSLEEGGSIDAAVDRLLDALGGDRVELLGLGEPTHGIEEPHALRNAMFSRLVERHGFTAVALESSFPRGWLVNEYVHGRVSGTFDSVREAGFSHGFGRLSAARELADWMRDHNARASADRRLNFYGFDGPMEMMYTDGPRQSVAMALEAFAKVDAVAAGTLRARIEPLLGDDGAWANERANMDASQSVGDSPAARALRLEVDGLVNAVAGPEYEGADALDRLDARHLAEAAAQLLGYHCGVATLPADERFAGMLSLRDAIMGEHLGYALTRERMRGGRVLVFAHNGHLQRGMARWQWGPNLVEWRPAGSHAGERFGDAYAVVAGAVGTVPDWGVLTPEAGTLEAVLCATPGPNRAVLTREIRAVAHDLRPRDISNPRLLPLSPGYLADYDAIVTFDTALPQRVDG